MAGPHEIRASRIAIRQIADRRGAVVGRNAGRRAVAVIDRNGKGGAVDRVIVGDHRRQMEPPGDLAGQRRTDDAAGMADDERHLLRRGVDRGEDQIALVLAIVVVGDDDDLAGGERIDRLADTGLGHVDPLGSSRPARQSRWRRGISGSQDAACRWSCRHRIARARVSRSGEFSNVAIAQLAGETPKQLRGALAPLTAARARSIRARRIAPGLEALPRSAPCPRLPRARRSPCNWRRAARRAAAQAAATASNRSAARRGRSPVAPGP